MEEKTKKILSGCLIGVLGLGAGGVCGSIMFPNEVPVVTEKIVEVEVPVEVIVTETVKETEYINVSVENPLNIAAMERAQEAEMQNDAMLDMLQDEIDEDIDVDYIIFEVDSKMEAERWIENELVDFLQDEDYFDNGEVLEDYRKSEVSVKTIYDAEILDRDFDDKDLELSYEVKIKAKESGEDREYFYFNVTIPFENGNIESDDIDVELM